MMSKSTVFWIGKLLELSYCKLDLDRSVFSDLENISSYKVKNNSSIVWFYIDWFLVFLEVWIKKHVLFFFF